jgi:hypothetical protein
MGFTIYDLRLTRKQTRLDKNKTLSRLKRESMKTIDVVFACTCLLLLCSCTTTPHSSAIIPASELPADVTMNKDAGRGNLLFVMLRLESGEELPFIVDTGASGTIFDISLEPKLGKRLKTTIVESYWGTKNEAGFYAEPKLYLGSTPLMTGSLIFTLDFKQLSSQTGRPVMGILGMDCLKHYCIQLDFEAGKMRFLDPDHMDAAKLGQAFPLTFSVNRPFIHNGSLIGEEGTNLVVDSGYRNDGALESGLFRREVLEQRLRAEGDAVNGRSGRVWFLKCVWNGETYTNLLIGAGGNVMGLRFLARHLVTFDFPKRTMYLHQTSVGPPVDENMEAAAEFFKALKEKDQLPGWSENDRGTIYLEPYPNFEAFDGRKHGDSSTYHYDVDRASKDSPWKLQKAWQTDTNGQLVKEHPVP